MTTKIYIDENLGGNIIAEGLAMFQNHLNTKEKYQFKVLPIPQSTPDVDWIPNVGSEGVVITQDLDIQTTRHERELYKKHGLGMFFFKAPKKGYPFWEMVLRIFNRWDEIKRKSRTTSKPFAYRITGKGKFELWDD